MKSKHKLTAVEGRRISKFLGLFFDIPKTYFSPYTTDAHLRLIEAQLKRWDSGKEPVPEWLVLFLRELNISWSEITQRYMTNIISSGEYHGKVLYLFDAFTAEPWKKCIALLLAIGVNPNDVIPKHCRWVKAVEGPLRMKLDWQKMVMQNAEITTQEEEV